MTRPWLEALSSTQLRAGLFHGLSDHSRLAILKQLLDGPRRPGPGRGRRDGRGLPPLRRRHPGQAEERGAERRALYVVAATFFLLAAYITYEAGTALLGREEPDRSTVGLVLSVLSLVIMPALAWWKQRTGREMGSRALVADAMETPRDRLGHHKAGRNLVGCCHWSRTTRPGPARVEIAPDPRATQAQWWHPIAVGG
jgi:cation efflux family protein